MTKHGSNIPHPPLGRTKLPEFRVPTKPENGGVIPFKGNPKIKPNKSPTLEGPKQGNL